MFVSVKSKISALEDLMILKGRKTYLTGCQFHANENMTLLQMKLYNDFLKAHNIVLEDVFIWFFDKYLPEEFNVDGFKMQFSSSNSYIEKCRNLASEMEGILKQFKMFVEEGNIDRELFEFSSEQVIFKTLPSFVSDKYAYPTKNLNNEIQELFSDQTTLSFTQKTKSDYSTLFDLLTNEEIYISDYEEHKIDRINELIKRGSLVLETDGIIRLNEARVAILRDLYEHEVCCTSYWGKYRHLFYEMKKSGDISFESTLFSEPEAAYLNYILNKSQFTDGLDLRNKYAHSNYSQDEDIQKADFTILLKIMVFIIIKINEEFCLRERQKGVQNS